MPRSSILQSAAARFPLLGRRPGRALVHGAVALALLLTSLAARPSPAAAEPAPLPAQLWAGVNRLRAEAGLAPLAETATLDAVAADRCADMVTRQYFSHTTPDGLDVFALLAERGIGFQTAGENLAWNTYGEDQAAAVALDGFLNSPPHRANLLDPAFSQLGVGVVRDGGKLYFTLVFAG